MTSINPKSGTRFTLRQMLMCLTLCALCLGWVASFETLTKVASHQPLVVSPGEQYAVTKTSYHSREGRPLVPSHFLLWDLFGNQRRPRRLSFENEDRLHVISLYESVLLFTRPARGPANPETELVFWDVQGDRFLRRWEIPRGHTILAISQETGLLVTMVTYNPIDAETESCHDFTIWNLKSLNAVGTLKAPYSPGAKRDAFVVAEVSHDGTMLFLARGRSGGLVSAWTVETWQIPSLRKIAEVHTPPFYELLFAPGGQLFCLSGMGRLAEIWSTEEGRCVTVLAGRGSPFGIRFVEDANEVVLLDSDSGLVVQALKGGITCWQPRRFLSLEESSSFGTSIAISPNGRTALWSKEDRGCLTAGWPMPESDLVVLDVLKRKERSLRVSRQRWITTTLFSLGFLIWSMLWCLGGHGVRSSYGAVCSTECEQRTQRMAGRRKLICRALLATSGGATIAWSVWIGYAFVPFVFIWVPILGVLSGVVALTKATTGQAAAIRYAAGGQMANIALGNVVSSVFGLIVLILMRGKTIEESGTGEERTGALVTRARF